MAPGTKQENACRQQYDFRQKKKIIVSIKFSHRCPTMLAKGDIMYVASTRDKTNLLSSTSSMQRKAAQFKQYARDDSNLVNTQKSKNRMKEMSQKCMRYKASVENVVNVRADTKNDNIISRRSNCEEAEEKTVLFAKKIMN